MPTAFVGGYELYVLRSIVSTRTLKSKLLWKLKLCKLLRFHHNVFSIETNFCVCITCKQDLQFQNILSTSFIRYHHRPYHFIRCGLNHFVLEIYSRSVIEILFAIKPQHWSLTTRSSIITTEREYTQSYLNLNICIVPIIYIYVM